MPESSKAERQARRDLARIEGILPTLGPPRRPARRSGQDLAIGDSADRRVPSGIAEGSGAPSRRAPRASSLSDLCEDLPGDESDSATLTRVTNLHGSARQPDWQRSTSRELPHHSCRFCSTDCKVLPRSSDTICRCVRCNHSARTRIDATHVMIRSRVYFREVVDLTSFPRTWSNCNTKICVTYAPLPTCSRVDRERSSIESWRQL